MNFAISVPNQANNINIMPGYFSELKNYPKQNPIFIGTSWAVATYIYLHGGVCLLCSNQERPYKLEWCQQRECWVLYGCLCELPFAKRLSEALINNGAAKVEILSLTNLLAISEDLV